MSSERRTPAETAGNIFLPAEEADCRGFGKTTEHIAANMPKLLR